MTRHFLMQKFICDVYKLTPKNVASENHCGIKCKNIRVPSYYFIALVIFGV